MCVLSESHAPAPAPDSGATAPDDLKVQLAGLNEAQRLAVEHGAADSDARALLIVAGPGSGKTDTLTHRVAHLIRNGADPQRLLLLTFSRRAAAEMETGRQCAADWFGHASAGAPVLAVGRHLPRNRCGHAANRMVDSSKTNDLMRLLFGCNPHGSSLSMQDSKSRAKKSPKRLSRNPRKGRHRTQVCRSASGPVNQKSPAEITLRGSDLVGGRGLEPPTPTMSRWCSNQLS